MTEDTERFRERYLVSGDAVMLAAEMETLGSDYQASGYTTRAQADELGRRLGLARGELLADIGAGCGWPGLYLAANHGCAVISLDPVIEGLRVAKSRSTADGLEERSWIVSAGADALPLRSESVDAIVQTDVLC